MPHDVDVQGTGDDPNVDEGTSMLDMLRIPVALESVRFLR